MKWFGARKQPSRNWHCVIFDIDGVVADASIRLATIRQQIAEQGEEADLNELWHRFHGPEMLLDKVIELGAAMVRSYIDQTTCKVFFVTNRPIQYLFITDKWLSKQFERDRYELLMRPPWATNEDWKESAVRGILERGYKPYFAVDDDPHHIDVYARLNIPFLLIDSGYYKEQYIPAANTSGDHQ